MLAKLILETGEIFTGKSLGYHVDTIVAELVFNTSMSGFQEILTDPSYYGQMVTFSYPLVGNYGFNADDLQSDSPKISAVLVREDCKFPSNFRCEMTLRNYLRQHQIPGIKGIDTRAIVRCIRQNPGRPAIITTKDLTQQQIRSLFASYNNDNAVEQVATKEAFDYSATNEKNATKVAVIDYGVKRSILDGFVELGCHVRVFPFTTSSEELAKWQPDTIFLSNGPGDPAVLKDKLDYLTPFVGKTPILGICLGHQLLTLALGGETSRLNYGHRGGNHPVLDIQNDTILVTSQNHGFHASTLPEGAVETHKNLIDQSNEGMMIEKLGIKSVQFHPEAGPGPNDGLVIFKQFLDFANQFNGRKN